MTGDVRPFLSNETAKLTEKRSLAYNPTEHGDIGSVENKAATDAPR
jgi:hypothetical protein